MESKGNHADASSVPVFIRGVVFCVMVASMVFIMFPQEPDPHRDACHDFAKHVDGLSVGMCIDYLETNPDSTGMQMLDHYSLRSFHDILTGPVVLDS